MESIGIRELRQHASRYVGLAKSGQRVAVTDRGRLVAYLVPAEEPASVLARLEAAGEYRPPSGSIADVLPELSDPPDGVPVSETVRQMRDEERW